MRRLDRLTIAFRSTRNRADTYSHWTSHWGWRKDPDKLRGSLPPARPRSHGNIIRAHPVSSPKSMSTVPAKSVPTRESVLLFSLDIRQGIANVLQIEFYAALLEARPLAAPIPEKSGRVGPVQFRGCRVRGVAPLLQSGNERKLQTNQHYTTTELTASALSVAIRCNRRDIFWHLRDSPAPICHLCGQSTASRRSGPGSLPA